MSRWEIRNIKVKAGIDSWAPHAAKRKSQSAIVKYCGICGPILSQIDSCIQILHIILPSLLKSDIFHSLMWKIYVENKYTGIWPVVSGTVDKAFCLPGASTDHVITTCDVRPKSPIIVDYVPHSYFMLSNCSFKMFCILHIYPWLLSIMPCESITQSKSCHWFSFWPLLLSDGMSWKWIDQQSQWSSQK